MRVSILLILQRNVILPVGSITHGCHGNEDSLHHTREEKTHKQTLEDTE